MQLKMGSHALLILLVIDQAYSSEGRAREKTAEVVGGHDRCAAGGR